MSFLAFAHFYGLLGAYDATNLAAGAVIYVVVYHFFIFFRIKSFIIKRSLFFNPNLYIIAAV